MKNWMIWCAKYSTLPHLFIYLCSLYLKISPLFCVSHAFEKGNPYGESHTFEKICRTCGIVNNGRPLFGSTRSGAQQPAQTRSNPRWRRQRLGQCDRRRISANFPYPEGLSSFDSFDFRRIHRYDVTTKTITIEFYIIQHRVLATLRRPLLLVTNKI